MTSNELLIESFERAAAEQGRLTGRFYELLFTRYPAARALFDILCGLERGWVDFPRRAADAVAARLGWTGD